MSIDEELKNAGLMPRTSLLVYLTNVSDQYKLRRFGDIVYFSKKMKYCILYVDSNIAKQMMHEIAALDFVKEVKLSKHNELDMSSKHIETQISTMAKEAEEKLQEDQKKNEDLFK